MPVVLAQSAAHDYEGKSSSDRSMSVFKAFIRPPIRLSVPAAIRPARPTLVVMLPIVMMLPVVVRFIVGIIHIL